MSGDPEVSIVIPTYNEEDYLRSTLEAFNAQKTDFDYEIIVSDANSTDSTADIARELGARVVFEPKRTIAAGRQTGSINARGNMIAGSCADVYAGPNWLEKLVEPLKKGSYVAVIGPVIPKDGNIVENAFARSVLKPMTRVLSSFNLHFVAGENFAVRKDIFDLVGGFNTDMITAEDANLIKRMKKHGKIAYAHEAEVYISMRRVRKWGYAKYLLYHSSNFFRQHIFSTGHKDYEPIR